MLVFLLMVVGLDRWALEYGVPSVSKILTNAILVYLPLIYKYDTDLAKYLPDLYTWARYNISDLDL